MLKIALLSFAHLHSSSYAQELQKNPDIELLCADPPPYYGGTHELRGQDLASELGVSYVDSYQEIWSWKPHAVIVCSENVCHKDLVLAAARNHCHVLCEKPLATTLEDARVMVDACREMGVFLMTAYPVRFAPEFQVLKDLVRSGQLGILYNAAGTNNGKIPLRERSWFTNAQLSGGGAFMDHIVHVADLLDNLNGGQLAQWVHAVKNAVLHRDDVGAGVETGGLVMVGYPDGVIATIDCSWSQPDESPTWGGLTLELTGSDGSASIAPFSSHVRGLTNCGSTPLWLGYGPDLDELMLGAFLDGVRGNVHPQPDGCAGLRTLAIAVAAQQSAQEGKRVFLPRMDSFICSQVSPKTSSKRKP